MNKDRKIRILYCIIFLLVMVIAAFFVRRIIIRRLSSRRAGGSPYYDLRVNTFRDMPRNTGQILFLGDSITDWCKFDELLPFPVINRGIAGDTTTGVLNRLDEVISLRPKKLFLLIGTNDIALCLTTDTIAGNIRKIIARIQEGTPETKIYIQGLFPTRGNAERPNVSIQDLNGRLKVVAGEMHCTYIELYPLLLVDGELGREYTIDGLHLTGAAMARWMEFLKPYLDE